jgi:hypothetical protein
MTRDVGDHGDKRALRNPVLLFRSPDVPITRSPDLTALCLHPPAMDPPGGSCFVANKRENEFDRTVTERSMPFLCVFQGANQDQFQPYFPF